MSKLKISLVVLFTIIAVLASTRTEVQIYVHEFGHAYGGLLVGIGTWKIEVENDRGYASYTNSSPLINSGTTGAYTLFFVLALLMIKFFRVWGVVACVFFVIGGIDNINSQSNLFGKYERFGDFASINIGAIIAWFPYHLGVWFIPNLIRYFKARSASRKPPVQSRSPSKVVPAQTRSHTKPTSSYSSQGRREPSRSLPRSSRGPIV